MKPIKVYERWSRLSFVVHRTPSGKMLWTLVHQAKDGTRRWDRRLGWGELACLPGSPESADAWAALRACLEDGASGPGGEEPAGPPTPPEGPAPPGGPQGDTPPGS